MINLLILSVGTRNKIIQYFMRALTDKSGQRTGKVIATDMSELAPAIYESDKFYQVSPMRAPGYIEEVFDICKKEKITAVLSLIDPELSLLAQHQKDFKKLGVTVIGSPYQVCELSLDKIKMYHWLTKHSYKTAKSYLEKETFYSDIRIGNARYPVFVKPVRGSASLAVSKVNDGKTMDVLFENADNLMIQEYLNGQEIGADVYIDLISGDVVSIFTKRKILMRAGETDKSVSFKDVKLFDLITRFVKEAGFRGQVDIDIFEIDGEYYISEVNPRFGGGYPHAYECGCNHMELILNNLKGIANEKKIGNYEEDVYMMKYNEAVIKPKKYLEH